MNVILIKECISSSHGEQYNGWRKEQTKIWCNILIVITKYNKLNLEVKLLIFDSSTLVYKLLCSATVILYFLRYQSRDAFIWLGSFLSSGQKLMSSGVAIALSLWAFSKKVVVVEHLCQDPDYPDIIFTFE